MKPIMSSSDVGALMSTVQWGDEGTYAREILQKGKLPKLAKVIKGQYLNVGVPSLANPSLVSTLILLSAGNSVRVAAQCVKFKEGRRVVPVGPKLAIPDTYEGHFEILSEDGRSVRCIESVSELAKKFPDSCLVREDIKAFVSRSDNVETITEKSRVVAVGETLILVGDVINSKNGKGVQNRFLRCFDQKGQNVYLPYDAKGKFSAIAKEDNISGVHSIKNLLNKRLPLMVRLIHGRPPVDAKASANFLPELRLFASLNEESLAVFPLGKGSSLIFLPPSAPLKLLNAKNAEQVEKTKEFMRLCERSTQLLQDASDKIHVYDTTLGSKQNNGLRDPRFIHLPDPTKHRPKSHHPHNHRTHRLIKSPSEKDGLNKNDINANSNKQRPLDDYDEIDQIYDYVRGFAPLPKHLRSPLHEKVNKKQSLCQVSEENDYRPTPPPIETIPTRKGEPRPNENLSPSLHPALISAVLDKAERPAEDKKPSKQFPCQEVAQKQGNPQKQTNHQMLVSKENKATTKLFVKASQKKSSKASKIFRQKSSSPIKETLTDVASVGPSMTTNVAPSGTSPSPLFKLRYKSLTNLAMDFDTLGSSTSGGKFSADSSGSAVHKAKFPEKKSQKLTRPKSLTSLFWDCRMGGPPLSHCPLGIGGNFRGPDDPDRKHRLEPGVYKHARDAPALLAATTRLMASQKKIGTLYL